MEKILNELPDEHISNETLWIYKENVDIFNKYTQVVNHKNSKQPKEELKQPKEELKPKEEPKQPKEEPKLKEEFKPKEEPKPKKEGKYKTESPIDLILRLTEVDKIMKVDIKNKLIEFISIPECSKVFGMKKSSEIMTALTKDSWNQSISLFISFLLNKHVIYKEKSYVYYKDKENEIITI
jgi:hypothetical protein